MRFHTGYGLEGVLPDAICQRIQQQSMLPLFREGRYGEGLVAGLQQVDQLLTNPAAAQGLLAQAGPPPRSAHTTSLSNWSAFRLIFGIVGGIGLLVWAIVKGMFHESFRSTSERRARDPRNSLRVRLRTWLMLYAVVPALIVFAWGELAQSRSIVACLMTIYGYLALTRALRLWRLHRKLQAMASKRQYTAAAQLLQQDLRYWLWMGLLFPLPWLAAYFFLSPAGAPLPRTSP